MYSLDRSIHTPSVPVQSVSTLQGFQVFEQALP